MSQPSTWNDKEHEQSDLTVALPVSEALHLTAVLPRLLKALEEQHARGPEDREYHRVAHASIASFLERLRESLRPFDVPEPTPGPAKPK